MIWEGPGSIFRGFGRRKRCLKASLGGEHFATDLSYVIGLLVGEKWPRSCQATGRLPRMPVLLCPGGDGRGAHGVGWPALFPPWGLSMESITNRMRKICNFLNHFFHDFLRFWPPRPHLFFDDFLMHASIQIASIFGTLSPSQSISFGRMFDTF